jgi:dynein heavy chain
MITQVKKLLMIYLSDNTSIVAEFEKQMMDLTKLYGEAKDNVKFLTTLER